MKDGRKYLAVVMLSFLFFLKLGSTAIGIQTSEGVCLAVEKRITSPLMEPSSIEKIVEIDAHIGKNNGSLFIPAVKTIAYLHHT